ncbi:hypothetical protein UFO1_2609 [Pelosinus sp. UFO1]|nr:hypothetical protein UFO1_2609 [Pelosinus sp. UFO1]
MVYDKVSDNKYQGVAILGHVSKEDLGEVKVSYGC